jgi:hypothetical protein
MKLDIHTGRAPLKLYAGQLGTRSKYTPAERVSMRDRARRKREATRRAAEHAVPTVVPYAVRNAISQAQERAISSAVGAERSEYLNQRLRENTL